MNITFIIHTLTQSKSLFPCLSSLSIIIIPSQNNSNETHVTLPKEPLEIHLVTSAAAARSLAKRRLPSPRLGSTKTSTKFFFRGIINELLFSRAAAALPVLEDAANAKGERSSSVSAA